MRPWTTLALILAVAALAPAASAGGGCAVEGSETARGTSKVRVYWKDGHLYGCVRKTGVTRHLYGSDYASGNQFDRAESIRVAGHRVAYAASSFCTVCGQPGPYYSIAVFDLRSGRHRHLGRVRGYDASETGVKVNALVLDRCGRVAYRAILFHSYDQDEDPDPELYTWVPGERRRVDRGSIGRKSIRLTPSAVHWRRDGEERSAPLSPRC